MGARPLVLRAQPHHYGVFLSGVRRVSGTQVRELLTDTGFLKLPESCKLVAPRSYKSTRRKCLQVLGTQTYAQWQYYENTIANLVASLLERVCYHFVDGKWSIPNPPSEYPVIARNWLELTAEVTRDLFKHVRAMANGQPPHSYRDVAMQYGGTKQLNYLRAGDRLDHGFQPSGFLACFAKSELTQVLPKRQVPRMIFPRSMEANLLLAVHIKHLEKGFYRSLRRMARDSGIDLRVTKGLNCVQTAAVLQRMWEGFSDPVCVGLDASKYDQHISPPLLRWEHSVYLEACTPENRADLRKVLGWQLTNRGIATAADGAIKFRLPGSRCSGDMNTAVGNCLIMCAAVVGFLRREGLRCSVADNGDDCLLIMERGDLRRLSPLEGCFRSVGIVLKIEPMVDVFERIEFCQSHPVRCGVIYRMIRTPDKLGKDTTFLHPCVEPSNILGFYGNVGDCGLALNAGCPVYQAFYNMLRRSSKGHRYQGPEQETGMRQMARGLCAVAEEVTIEARWSYYLAFNVPPYVQVQLERQFDTLTLDTGLVVAEFLPRLPLCF